MADYAAKAQIEVDGQPLDPALEPYVERVVVDDHLTLPDAFTIRLRDPDRTVIDRMGVAIKSAVRILATPLKRAAPDLVMAGEVTGVDGEWGPGGSHVVVRGYDLSHRLHRGRKTRAFEDVSDGDIVRQLAEEAGIPVAEVDTGGTVHEHVSQLNLTDWEFLTARAEETGMELLVEADGLIFRRPTEAGPAPAPGEYTSENPKQLVYGAGLISFRGRATAFGQHSQVMVRGWDPVAKRPLVAQAAASTTSVDVGWKPEETAAAAAIGGAIGVSVHRALTTQAAVDAAAAADAEHDGSAGQQTEADVVGDPLLGAGESVTISAVPSPFAGKYVVTRAVHRFDRRGYVTSLTMSGRADRSLAALVLGRHGSSTNGHHRSGGGRVMPGTVIGLVTDIKDPEGRGRVKVRYPWLDDAYQTGWVRCAMPGAGADRGFYVLPEVDDEVLLCFEQGDPRAPIIIGSLWNGSDAPPTADAVDGTAGSVVKRTWRSRKGSVIELIDTDGQESILLHTPDQQATLRLERDSASLLTQGDIELTAQRDISIVAGSKLAVQAGSSADVTAGSDLGLVGGGEVQVQGAMVRIN